MVGSCSKVSELCAQFARINMTQYLSAPLDYDAIALKLHWNGRQSEAADPFIRSLNSPFK